MLPLNPAKRYPLTLRQKIAPFLVLLALCALTIWAAS